MPGDLFPSKTKNKTVSTDHECSGFPLEPTFKDKYDFQIPHAHSIKVGDFWRCAECGTFYELQDWTSDFGYRHHRTWRKPGLLKRLTLKKRWHR